MTYGYTLKRDLKTNCRWWYTLIKLFYCNGYSRNSARWIFCVPFVGCDLTPAQGLLNNAMPGGTNENLQAVFWRTYSRICWDLLREKQTSCLPRTSRCDLQRWALQINFRGGLNPNQTAPNFRKIPESSDEHPACLKFILFSAGSKCFTSSSL